MKKPSTSLEVENARNLSIDQLAKTFIRTRIFEQLLSNKHHVLLGARGQGKTALFRMLSFDGLSKFARYDSYAKEQVDNRKFVGIYLPTKLEWIQSIATNDNSGGMTSEDRFRWKLNLSSCIALILTARSCIEYYSESMADRVRRELSYCRKICKLWQFSCSCDTFSEVLSSLKRYGFEWQVDLARREMYGVEEANHREETAHGVFPVFMTETFQPLSVGIELLSQELSLGKDTHWLLCIDEAEWMSSDQQKVINSFMRVAPENLFLKIATMPFSHYTLETENARAPLTPDHDFEYIHMNFAGAETIVGLSTKGDLGQDFNFEETLFKKVIEAYYPDMRMKVLSMSTIFGKSELIDRDIGQDWSPNAHYMDLLRRYGNDNLILRADKRARGELSEKDFKDAIARKLRGALLLREDFENTKGHSKSKIDSGAKMICVSADGNPRVFIRILKNLIERVLIKNCKWEIPPEKQEEVLVALGENFLNQIKSYQTVGPRLYKIVAQFGRYLSNKFHHEKMGTDFIGSFKIDEPKTEDDRELLQSAIKYGVIKPNDTTKINFGVNTIMKGEYRLSYTFCPYFRTMPRKGKPKAMESFSSAAEIEFSLCDCVDSCQEAKQLVMDFEEFGQIGGLRDEES